MQKRAVKAITNLKGKTYEERLKELGLDTLEERRKRGDLIQAYKVLTGKVNVKPDLLFQLSEPADGAVRTRARNGYKNVIVPSFNGEIRRNFWSIRCVDNWNALPTELKNAATLDAFKCGYDKLISNLV